MLIFDYRNQNLLDYQFIILGFILLITGLTFLLRFSKVRLETKENYISRLFGFSKEMFDKQENEFPFIKSISIFFIVVSFPILYLQFEPYIYTKNINCFENINSLSARIDSVETKAFLGANTITFYVKNKSFSIIEDSRYVGNRNLAPNDSVRIDYFEKELKIGHMKVKCFEVTRIELK